MSIQRHEKTILEDDDKKWQITLMLTLLNSLLSIPFTPTFWYDEERLNPSSVFDTGRTQRALV